MSSETATSEAGHRPGRPRPESDAAFLERFDARMRLPIIVSAILPLIVVPESGDWIGVVVGIVTWLVFLVDYVVHARHLERYGRTRLGRFDLFVVIATAPWFLFPGAHAGGFVILLRLARLARLAMASRGARRLFQRLGRVAAVAGGVVIVGSSVAYYAEHPTNPGFATVGDALWWGIVTLTTVGYGDIVPKTTAGRWAAVTIMITGIAVLGLLAGALASFFRLDQGETPAAEPAGTSASSPAASSDAALQALTAEVAALRRQVEALTRRLIGTPADPTSNEPITGEDAQALTAGPPTAASDRVIDGINQLPWLAGQQASSAREGYLYWMGPELYGVKWRNFKLALAVQKYSTDPVGKLPSPRIINLVADPQEREPLHLPYLHSWTATHFSRLLADYQASVQRETPVPAGAPLDFIPPHPTTACGLFPAFSRGKRAVRGEGPNPRADQPRCRDYWPPGSDGCHSRTVSLLARRTRSPAAGVWPTTRPSTGIGRDVSWIGSTCRPTRPATSMHAP